VRDLRSTLDLRELGEISAQLSRHALSTPRRVFAAAIAIVILTGAATGVLARAYHDARHRGALRQFHEAEVAATAGRPEAALDRYRAALALDRENVVYRRAVALSLVGLRRTTEAETHLNELLRHDPVDGEANLVVARLAGHRGAYGETEAFYQRAIYGRWTTDQQAHRLAARFELIEWLEQMGAVASARAELLRLQAELPDSPFLLREVAKRLLDVNQPGPAADVFRRELARSPADASLAADLARAEMEAGSFAEARDAARRALALDPRDRESRARFDQATEVLSLDPNRRGLSSAERLRRSQRLLQRVLVDLDACAGKSGEPWPADLTTLVAGAQAMVANQDAAPQGRAARGGAGGGGGASGGAGISGGGGSGASGASAGAAATTSASSSSSVQKLTLPMSDATAPAPLVSEVDMRTDARVAAAEQLWKARVARCGASTGALAWIFDRLSN
jgi:tetratricopeptide (TPR) repeat protein